ncbi:MAG: hypothetical protein QOK43_1463 [Acidimicrobiaceae bacterium]|nr:hypothetical protein [Acidimicrobiaceae bacterium]
MSEAFGAGGRDTDGGQADTGHTNGGDSTRRADLAALGAAWTTSRAVVVGSLVMAHVVADTIGPMRRAVPQHLGRGLLDWDAERYFQIASKGYGALPRIQLRFFPLVPLAARALDRVLPGGAGAALLVLANLSALALGWLVLRLVVHEGGDAATARTAVWLVFFTPAAFVLAWGYTEPVWGCLCVGMFLALRRRQWWAAAAVGLLAGLTRPVAPLLVVPALVEAARGWRSWLRSGQWRAIAARVAAVASPVAGVGVYLWWVWANYGNALLPYRIQQGPKFRGSLTDPFTPILHTAGAAFGADGGLAALRVMWAAVLVVLVVLALRWWPASYGLFAAAVVLVALSTQRLGSFERYGFSAFPVVLALAVLVRKRPGALPAAIAVGAAAVMGYGTLALLGSYVP